MDRAPDTIGGMPSLFEFTLNFKWCGRLKFESPIRAEMGLNSKVAASIDFADERLGSREPLAD